ncbi:unnamed protein product [Effrenium voratum]|uniref:Peptidase M20 dimerisation domain-containing protein n=1 Tax=Effrenium voratum TaxID=2562239 RepID=A0AA36JB16_9DINO|nr:unnamed protein product [Effrenium voratum]
MRHAVGRLVLALYTARAFDVSACGEPQALWRYFRKLLEIPRCTENERAVLDYIADVAKHAGLSSRFNQGNLVVSKPSGDSGEPVIIQAHVDMVCEKHAESSHDFTSDGIQAVLSSGWLSAPNTTLGADNGIGVATALSLMQHSGRLPPLEFVFTIQEEKSLDGARAIDAKALRSKRLLNFDSEEWGILYMGCAGGAVDVLEAKMARVLAPPWQAVELVVDGLAGGHSGADIHLGRGNALKVAAQATAAMVRQGAKVESFDGGDADNAIPRRAVVTLAMPAIMEKAKASMAELQAELLAKLPAADAGLKLTLRELERKPKDVLEEASQKLLLELLEALHHGPVKFSADVPGLVETSSNLGIVKFREDVLEVTWFARSSVDTELALHRAGAADLARRLKLRLRPGEAMPGWKADLSSQMLALVKEEFQLLEHREAEVATIHAGLECGAFAQKVPGIDMVSFGPDIQGAHAPGERVNVESVRRFWALVLRTLARLATSESAKSQEL